jgi:Transposase IS116/IS110/IS902 family
MSGSAAADDASRGGCVDRAGFCADHRESRAISVWEADRSYLGLVPLEDSSGNRRRLGHITKEDRSMLRFLLVEAAQTEDHQGCPGAETGGSSVLEVAQGMRLPASFEVRFARVPARIRRWCAVEHRVID